MTECSDRPVKGEFIGDGIFSPYVLPDAKKYHDLAVTAAARCRRIGNALNYSAIAAALGSMANSELNVVEVPGILSFALVAGEAIMNAVAYKRYADADRKDASAIEWAAGGVSYAAARGIEAPEWAEAAVVRVSV